MSSSLREEITKTFRRLSRLGHPRAQSHLPNDETLLATDAREGRVYGSYRILRRVGFGGMGLVYLAQDVRLGRQAALKFLDHKLTDDPEMLERLYLEARTASSLNHPNILTIYDIAEANGEHFIASEFVEGITVRAALDQGGIEPKNAAEIAAQVASALIPAHEAGVIHRDLKASNIMIRPDGLVKVIDFGLAKVSPKGVLPGSPTLSAAGSVAGTAEYMSPEQARGEPLDHRTDLWSLGVVLYEMLTGRVPFEGETESHVIVAILDQAPKPLGSTGEQLRGVGRIVDRALTKDRNKRYQAAGEVLKDLEDLGVTRQRISAIRRFTQARKPMSPRAPWLAAVAVAGLALAVWWWPFHGRERVLGPSWFEPGTPRQVTTDGNVRLASISPDGQYLAYVTRTGTAGTLRLRNLKTNSDALLPYEGEPWGLTFSPDSQSLYYVLHDSREWGRLFSVPVTGGVSKMILDDIDGPITFSPEGRQFAFRRRDEQKRTSIEKIIVSWASDTGDQREILRKSNTDVEPNIGWSPEGNRIAAVIFNPGLQNPVAPHLFLLTPGGQQKESFSTSRLRRFADPTWIGKTGVLALTGFAQAQTNQQAKLYELSTVTGEFRQFPSPVLASHSLSATSDGQTLAAIRVNRSSSLWVSSAETGGSPQIVKPNSSPVDIGAADSFTWLGSDQLILPASDGETANLAVTNLAAQVRRLIPVENCVKQQPVAMPGKTAVVYSSNCGSGGGDFNLWQLDLRTGQRIRLTSGSNFDGSPDVTPDGKWIVYTSWPSINPSIWKIPAGGGTAQPLSSVQADHASVSPDGQRIVCEIRENYDGQWRVAILSLADGSVQKEILDLPRLRPVRWSQDGQALDYLSADAKQIWRRPLEGGPAQPLIPPQKDPIIDFEWSPDGKKLAMLRGHLDSDVILIPRTARSRMP